MSRLANYINSNQDTIVFWYAYGVPNGVILSFTCWEGALEIVVGNKVILSLFDLVKVIDSSNTWSNGGDDFDFFFFSFNILLGTKWIKQQLEILSTTGQKDKESFQLQV